MKTYSIISIVVFALSLICVAAFQESDVQAAMGWGVIASFYGLIFAIVATLKTGKKDSTAEMMKLKHLKEAGILDEDQYKIKMAELLS